VFRQSLGALLVAAVLAALGPAPAQTGKKPAQTDKKTAETDKKPAVTEKTYPLGTYAGKVLDVDDSKQTIKVKVYNKAAQLTSISSSGRPSFSVRDKPFDLTITVADKAKFRVPAQQEFDSKGKPKPTKIDKKDPDWKLGGVKGQFSDVEKDQQAVFRLRRNKAGTLVVADVVIVLGKEER